MKNIYVKVLIISIPFLSCLKNEVHTIHINNKNRLVDTIILPKFPNLVRNYQSKTTGTWDDSIKYYNKIIPAGSFNEKVRSDFYVDDPPARIMVDAYRANQIDITEEIVFEYW